MDLTMPSHGQEGALLTPDMIRSIREQLELTQEEAGELIGGGPRAFQKYESGEIEPAASVAKLLRLLNEEPALLQRLKAAPGDRRAVLPPRLAITDADIVSLSARQLQDTLRALILAEANAANLEHSWLHTPAQIDAPDGGEDGRIAWRGGPASTRYLPARTVVFQAKATAMSAAKCAQEIMAGKKAKARIRTVLESGGAYVLAVSRSMTQKDLDTRLQAMRSKLAEAGLAARVENVRLYSATQLADWVNGHPAVAIGIRERLGHASPFRSFDAWARRTEHGVTFQDDDRLEEISNLLGQRLTVERGVARLVGQSGVGKSRLAIATLSGTSPEIQRLRAKALYVDLMGSEHDASLRDAVQRLIDNNMDALIVVENCAPDTHGRLSTMISSQRSRLPQVT